MRKQKEHWKRWRKIMQLTKEQAIKEHRKMWNWIADQYKNGCTDFIYDIEDRYIKECTNYSPSDFECWSFCCEYSIQNDVLDSCDSCPLVWGNVPGFAYCLQLYGTSENGDMRGLYAKIADETWNGNEIDFDKVYKLCKQITDLPERR